MTHRFLATVATPRLTLRHWTADDIPAMAMAISASLETLQGWIDAFNDEPESASARQARIERWQASWEAGGDSLYGIFSEGAVVGGCGLHRRVGPNAIEIGYWIHSDHHRRGFATEATAALTAVAFGDPTIETIEIHHDRANAASAGVARSAGYTFDRETPDRVRAPRGVGIDWCWVMTRKEWARRGSATN